MLSFIEHLIVIGQTWTGATATGGRGPLECPASTAGGAAWTRYGKFVVLGSHLRLRSERDGGSEARGLYRLGHPEFPRPPEPGVWLHRPGRSLIVFDFL